MRTVLIYMLSLALLVLGGYHYVTGATNHRRHPVRFIISAEKFRFANTDQAHLDNTISSEDKQSIFNVEDEDEDFVFSRKYLQLTGYFVTLFYAAFLLYSLKNLKKRLLIVTRLIFAGPQRYILQGALLI
jgi:hypothetical protein